MPVMRTSVKGTGYIIRKNTSGPSFPEASFWAETVWLLTMRFNQQRYTICRMIAVDLRIRDFLIIDAIGLRIRE